MDNFWLNNINILFSNNNFLKFYPKKGMTKNEILNSIMRFSIYLFFLIVLFGNNKKNVLLPIIIMIITIVLNKTEKYNIENFKNDKCQRPTENNPFMNATLNDFANHKERLDACNIEDDDIKENIDNFFNKNLYRDVDDIYDRKNSQRAFFTMPNVKIMNDQTKFAKWLYKTPLTCKEDNSKCLKYEDVRTSRHNPHLEGNIQNIDEFKNY